MIQVFNFITIQNQLDFISLELRVHLSTLLLCTVSSVTGDITRYVGFFFFMLINLSCGCSHNGREEVFH